MVVLFSGSWINNMLCFGGLFVIVLDFGVFVLFWLSLLFVFFCNIKILKWFCINIDKLLLLIRLNMFLNVMIKCEYIVMILICWNRILLRNKRFWVFVNECFRFLVCKFYLIVLLWKKIVYKMFILLNGF